MEQSDKFVMRHSLTIKPNKPTSYVRNYKMRQGLPKINTRNTQTSDDSPVNHSYFGNTLQMLQ
jgi:hypothetical protein